MVVDVAVMMFFQECNLGFMCGFCVDV
jgi:hypothetical protein